VSDRLPKQAPRRRERLDGKSASTLTVAICCADPVVGERLEQILGKDHGIVVAANVDEPADLVALIEDFKLDAVLIDARFFEQISGGGEIKRDAPPLVEPARLTPRELEVLGAMADGASNKTIARRLGISFHTAKFHVAAILTKLDADSRTEAVAKAAQTGLVML
jgi:DNA-binding NarL/FixJ family response regulator